MKKIKEIEFDMFENGLDFIDNALKPILDNHDDHDLKYSVLHIYAGTELILKEILKTEHWSLIFENINKANIMQLASGDFESASFETTIYRLENVANVSIPENAKKYIRQLRNKRNRMEHFAFKEIDAAIKSNVSKVLSHVIELIRDNLEIKKYSKRSQQLHASILKKSAKFNEFTNLTNAKLAKDLEILKKEKVRLIDCPECFQHTLPLNENLTCLFCGYNDTPENVVTEYVEKILGINGYEVIKDGGYYPVEACPDCHSDTLLVRNDTYLCFSCKEEWKHNELKHCEWCNYLFHEKDVEVGMCQDCIEHNIERYISGD
ncbi:MAG: hypothetical protein A2041_02225 [Bacteroidetes bacterium GWA2_31_9b]|nr:MAG: hypothetical protein A2041_02225 [Bacteroidetes bacterium GWA2_31_9b]